MGLLRFLAETVIITCILILFLAYSPLFLDCDPKAVSLTLPKTFSGPLAVNSKLNKADKLFPGKVNWPESLAVQDGIIYTGVNDGKILRIEGSKVSTVLRSGEDCEGPWEEPKCGRPLGMRFHNDKQLYVVDAFYGILKVDVTKGTKQVILPSSTQVDGKPLTFMNDLAIDQKGIIYFTQSSTRWNLTLVMYTALEHDVTGRLLSFDPSSQKVSVLAKGLLFPNGVELSPDGSKLLFAECSGRRIMQYDLTGPNKGKTSVLIQNLPGEPDNIRRSPRGGYWVALIGARTQATPSLQDHLGAYPLVRKVLMRLLHGTGSLLTYIASYLPYPAVKELAFNALSGRFLVDILPVHGMILRIDENGQIIETLQSPDGKFALLSEVLEHDGHLYIGSWRNKFLARLKL